MLTYLERAGLVVRWQDDLSQAHRAVADALIDAFAADATDIAAQIGRQALDELLAAHRLWSDWLREGRVRKFAFVAIAPEPIGAITSQTCLAHSRLSSGYCWLCPRARSPRRRFRPYTCRTTRSSRPDRTATFTTTRG